MKELKFIFKQMWSKDPFMYFIIVFYAVLNGLLPFIWILAPAYVIENRSKNLEFFLLFFVGLFLITSIIRFLSSFLTGNYRMRMNRLRYGLNTKVIEYSLSLSYTDQQDNKMKEKITQANRAIEFPFDGFGGIILFMPETMSLIVSLIGFLWIFTVIDWYLVVYVIIMTILSGRYFYKLTFTYEEYWDNIEETWEKLEQLNYELKNPISKLDILMYDITSILKKYYFGITDLRNNELKANNIKVMNLGLKARFINLLRDIPVFIWLINRLYGGFIEVSEFYVLFTAVFGFILSTYSLSMNLAEIAKNIKFFRPYFDISLKPVDTLKEIDFDKFELTLKDVCFKYPSSYKNILNHINLTIHDKESIALVGENGAGKTTLALIIAGLYEPTSGEILLNGKNIRDYSIDQKSYISAVFQDSLLLPYSIKENVLMSNRDYDLTELYEKTGLNSIIKTYDNGDKQILLRTLSDDGVDLSGGQKQRLFLARALNKTHAKLLLLDEPTAQLDAIAERDLYELYNSEAKDKSSVFISHRLASTKFCDRVIFLKNGEIIEEGSHDKLMNLGGEYAELFEIQAKNYKEVNNA
ncbi:ABC transporter ATP-binding protein [uncultured Anaerococcus sp.]|uniref:ATP-binding cassette domain-containing protein n=1 Tax=uncultured Anaerococcus sp. TaxID=293428 RepID=UPI0026236E7B|nr:ABC transporter ATP-binding protein [uncultured Anaerococcus sp.]